MKNGTELKEILSEKELEKATAGASTLQYNQNEQIYGLKNHRKSFFETESE